MFLQVDGESSKGEEAEAMRLDCRRATSSKITRGSHSAAVIEKENFGPPLSCALAFTILVHD